LAGEKNNNKSLKTGGAEGSGMGQKGGARKGKQANSVMGVEGVNNNKASGVNLSKLGLGAGKILDKTGPSAIHTKFVNSAGGAGGGSGSASKTYGLGGVGSGHSLGLAGTGSAVNNFGSGAGGDGSGQGGTGGLGGAGLGRGFGTKGNGNGRGRANVVVPPGDPVVSGGLTSQEVQAVIRANLNQIRHCYEQLLQRSPSASGKVKVKFTINASGRVTGAQIEQSSINDSVMKGCVTGKVVRWKFPEPRGGQAVTVSYPFVFNPL
jgi:TonB family protein